MVTATHYTIERVPGSQMYLIRNQDAPMCPACGCLLSGYDTRARHVVNSAGTAIWFQLRRLRCPACRRLHLELPDFMRAGKHYAAPIIDDAVAGRCASCPADDSTIRRWKR